MRTVHNQDARLIRWLQDRSFRDFGHLVHSSSRLLPVCAARSSAQELGASSCMLWDQLSIPYLQQPARARSICFKPLSSPIAAILRTASLAPTTNHPYRGLRYVGVLLTASVSDCEIMRKHEDNFWKTGPVNSFPWLAAIWGLRISVAGSNWGSWGIGDIFAEACCEWWWFQVWCSQERLEVEDEWCWCEIKKQWRRRMRFKRNDWWVSNSVRRVRRDRINQFEYDLLIQCKEGMFASSYKVTIPHLLR